MEAGPSTTDWITAIATAFAAVGTVGAVVVALRQSFNQGQRKLMVRCSQAIIGDVENIGVLTLRGTNDGPRPVKVSMAYLMTDDGRQVNSPFTPHSATLPILLNEGESAEVFWTRKNLEELRRQDDCNYLYAFFTDVLGEVYIAPYPGVVARRKGLRRQVVYERPTP